MKLKIFISAYLLFILLQTKAQDKFGKDKYVIYTDTGYVCFAQPHFYCYFISSNKSLEETLTKSPYLYYIGVNAPSLKGFYIDNIDNDSTGYIIKTKADLYEGGKVPGIISGGLYFFRAVVQVQIPFLSFKFKDKDYVREQIHYKGKSVRLYRIISSFDNLYDFNYIPLREAP